MIQPVSELHQRDHAHSAKQAEQNCHAVSPSDAQADGTISDYIPFLSSSFSLSDLEGGSDPFAGPYYGLCQIGSETAFIS